MDINMFNDSHVNNPPYTYTKDIISIDEQSANEQRAKKN